MLRNCRIQTVWNGPAGRGGGNVTKAPTLRNMRPSRFWVQTLPDASLTRPGAWAALQCSGAVRRADREFGAAFPADTPTASTTQPFLGSPRKPPIKKRLCPPSVSWHDQGRGFAGVSVFSPHDVAGICEHLARQLSTPVAQTSYSRDLTRFDRRQQADRLADVLNQVATAGSAHAAAPASAVLEPCPNS